MIKYEFQDIDCEISIDTEDAEEPTEIVFAGNPKAISEIKALLLRAYGLYGHGIYLSSPAIDINHALLFSPIFSIYNPFITLGKEFIDSWEPPTLPESTVF